MIQFADIDMLDRLILTVTPVALPSGTPILLRRLGADRLTLANVQQRGQFAQLTFTCR